MTGSIAIDESSFRRILRRNVVLPLAVGLVSAVFFVVLIGYLLQVLKDGLHSNDVLRNVGESLRLSVDQETSFRGYLLSGDVHFLQTYEVAKPKIQAGIAILRELVAGNTEQLDHLSKIAELQNAWVAFSRERIAAKLSSGNYQDSINFRRGQQLTDAIRTEYGEFIAYERRQRQAFNESATRIAVVSTLLFLLFCMAFGGFLAFFGRRELLRLSATYGAILKEQAGQAEILHAQAWLRNGQTGMAERLFGQPSLPALGRNVLEYLAEHLGSVVGALYVCESHGALRRVAAYGFSREQAQGEPSFYRAEGLLGQAALRRDLLILEQLPADYLKVASGLGDGSPVTVALLPIDNDGEVNGVVELAFLKPLSAQERDFLRQIASSVGTAVEAARYRHRLQEVLAETQQLNEELQVQQEELKTANEELEAQSKALLESQVRLEQSNQQLSLQRDTLDERNASLRAAQQQLQERAEELQQTSRYKSEFLANMSHELRTPLNSALILAKLLGDNARGNLDAEQVEFAHLIHRAGQDLLNLINDILDLSKVEAGKLELYPEHIDLRCLLDGLESIFQPQARQKALTFELVASEDVPQTLYTDRLRLEQILKNLLSNAFKFTEQGVVSLRLTRAGGGLAFTVCDTGIGIPEEQQTLIFDAFQQGDGTISRRFAGTGLGLSISRNLAQLLGGSIAVSCRAEQGSQFTLWLPERYAAQPLSADGAATREQLKAMLESPDTAHPRQQRSVLLVAGDTLQRDSIARLIGDDGLDIVSVDSAEQAWGQLRSRAFACMIIELRLPGMQGSELLRRGREGIRELPPLIVYAGGNLSQDEKAELRRYSRAIIIKGENSAERLLDEVTCLLRQEPGQLPWAQPYPPNAVLRRDRVFAGRRILLVDDDVRNIFALTSALEQHGAQIEVARTGAEALDRLEAVGTIDLVLMDVAMPQMEGYAAARRIRENPRWRGLPIIAVIAKATKDDQHLCMQFGVNDYLPKPIDLQRLFSLIRVWLPATEQSGL
jgi:signal transduction histidine kinase/DNA-binding response OmpR family regulator/CHASE3 domain sensor protein